VAEMWFPAGLSTRLWGHKFSQVLRGKRSPAIFQLSPLVRHFAPGVRFESAIPEAAWHTPEACVQAANQVGAPVVWIGRVEPLLHPGIGKVTTALAQSGRHVFLDTSGQDLRKRVHEFQPGERFFFAFQLGDSEVAYRGKGNSRAFQSVIEALRIVKLSGFFACVHLIVGTQTPVAEMEPLFRSLETSRVDGIAVSSDGASASDASDTAFGKKIAEITGMIPSRPWRKLSRMLEASYPQTAGVQEQAGVRTRGTDACEESA